MESEEYEKLAQQVGIQGQMQQNAAQESQYYMQEAEKGLVETQLEVDTIKSDIYHLIRQDVTKLEVESGRIEWSPIVDQKQRTLSDWGVDRIMQIIHFYVNKNTLLSNFSEEQIKRIMLRFMNELNDLILLKYQLLFRQLTFEECKEILIERIDNKKKMKMFSLDILEKDYDEKKLNQEFLNEIETTLEIEIQKIREEQRKEKIRDYGLLIAQLEVMIFASLNRAWKGEERGSIRRRSTISELIGGQQPSAVQPKGGIFSWGRR